MKFIRLTQPNQESIAIRADLIETIRPTKFIPDGETFIVGESKITVGSLVTVQHNSYGVVEPVDEIVKQLAGLLGGPIGA